MTLTRATRKSLPEGSPSPSWAGLFPPSSPLSGRAGDVHSDLLLHDALHASAFHGQLLGDGSQGCDEGTFRGESSCNY